MTDKTLAEKLEAFFYPLPPDFYSDADYGINEDWPESLLMSILDHGPEGARVMQEITACGYSFVKTEDVNAAALALRTQAQSASDDVGPTLRSAFRTTVTGDGKYEMVFRFRTMDDMHKADDEWRAMLERRAGPVQSDIVIPITAQQPGADQVETWERCSIGSCHRHQECMYRPCCAALAAMKPEAQEDDLATIAYMAGRYDGRKQGARGMRERAAQAAYDRLHPHPNHPENDWTEFARQNARSAIMARNAIATLPTEEPQP